MQPTNERRELKWKLRKLKKKSSRRIRKLGMTTETKELSNGEISLKRKLKLRKRRRLILESKHHQLRWKQDQRQLRKQIHQSQWGLMKTTRNLGDE